MLVRGHILVRLRRIVLRRRQTCHDDGFTLLEVLVALGILGMSLSVLLGVFTMALDHTRSNQTRIVAERLAEAMLLQAETADASVPLDQRGDAAPNMRWTVKTTPYGGAEDRNAWQGTPKQILVQVQWQDHGRDRSLSLSTLKIVPGDGHD
jgi:prepilin-type N-terminal cleavage/methylation domain-containing protein